ncbi:MAG TPA: YraN family protein [Intrasporangiaceae bacterium]|nr:YraN family protein [Intrasporangiaceae bacterium]
METAATGQVGHDDRRTLGEVGETLVARYFRERGAQVLERNWQRIEGELDLIVREPAGAVVAVEVKTRRGLGFGEPLEAVTPAKQARLRRLLGLWLREHPDVGAGDVRLDVVGVLIRPGAPVHLRHLTGVGG